MATPANSLWEKITNNTTGQIGNLGRLVLTGSWQTLGKEIINITDENICAVFQHYPKTTIISTMTMPLFLLISFSFAALFTVSGAGYLVYRHNVNLTQALKKFEDAQISEWTSSFDDKDTTLATPGRDQKFTFTDFLEQVKQAIIKLPQLIRS